MLVKCKMQDNLEFLQWTKRYWDQYFPGMSESATTENTHSLANIIKGGDYDPLARRKGAAGAPMSASTPAAGRPSTTARRPVNSSAAPVGSRTRTPLGGGGAASAALQQENNALKETVQGLERERDFYFSKLRDIELLVQGAMEADPELEAQDDGLLKQIQTILYSTEVQPTVYTN